MQLDPTTIIFALLAIFVVWRLKSVLGTRVDVERPPTPGPAAPTGQPGEHGKVIRLPGAADRAGAGRPRGAIDVSAFASTEKG
ncbi:MAG: hypothetical protein KDJ30_14950, partial [Rhodoblastus sp.]|nr:hypothetical protein [Rhodoblastus sp.]